jgi:hypothetical protein
VSLIAAIYLPGGAYLGQKKNKEDSAGMKADKRR